jgi:hypothetical protein
MVIIILHVSHNPSAKTIFYVCKVYTAVPSAYLAELHYFWCTTTVRIRRVYGDYIIIIFIIALYCRVAARDRWRYVAAEQWRRVTVTEYSGHSVTTRPTYVISLFFFFCDLPIRSTITSSPRRVCCTVAPRPLYAESSKTIFYKYSDLYIDRYIVVVRVCSTFGDLQSLWLLNVEILSFINV